MEVQGNKSEPDKISDSWYNAKIESFLKIKMGQSPPSETYNDQRNGLPFFQGVTDFGDINPKSRIWCSEPRAIANSNQILLSVRAPVGEVNVTNFECCIGRGIAALEPMNSDLKYCFYLLKYFKSNFLKTSQGTTFEAINRNDIANGMVPFTNNAREQQKIGLILSKVDELIQRTDQVIEQTQSLKKGLMQGLLTRGIGHTKFKRVKSFLGKYEEIPETWNLSKLKDVSLKGLRNGIFKRPEEFGTGVPIVNVSDLFSEGDISIDKLERVSVSDSEREDFGVQYGDIFFCRSSLVMDGIGHSNIVTNLKEPAVFECHVMMLHPDKKKVSPKFLAYFTQSEMARRYIFCISMTLTMTTIRQPDLECMPILIPPLEEQQKIVSILSAVEMIIQNQQKFKSYFEKLKNGLMQKLLTGKIRVKV
jgi:type I restriction enzyme, S subunit